MTPINPSIELDEWIVYDLYNIHLKDGAPQYIINEFNSIFGKDIIEFD